MSESTAKGLVVGIEAYLQKALAKREHESCCAHLDHVYQRLFLPIPSNPRFVELHHRFRGLTRVARNSECFKLQVCSRPHIANLPRVKTFAESKTSILASAVHISHRQESRHILELASATQ